MKLNQITASDELSAVVIQRMMEKASVLQYAEFYRMVGNSEYARKSPTATGGQFRVVDSNYPDNIITPMFSNAALKILGDMVQIDQAHERRGYDIPSVRATELLNFAGNLARQFQNYFFRGDTSVNVDEFDGIKRLCPTAQKITAATNGHSVPMGNSDANKTAQQKFLELLDQLIESVTNGAQVIYMDGKTLSRLSTIAREFITVQNNEFGIPIKYYNGIPVLSAGYDKTGTRIIPHTETCGTSSNCTSIYAMRFGDRSDLTIATNIGLEVKDLGIVGAFYTHKVEMDAAMILLNDKSLARLEGIIIA